MKECYNCEIIVKQDRGGTNVAQPTTMNYPVRLWNRRVEDGNENNHHASNS